MLKTLLASGLKRSKLSARNASALAGLHPTTLSRWISGAKASPNLADVLRVGRVLRIPESKLIAALAPATGSKRRRPAARSRKAS